MTELDIAIAEKVFNHTVVKKVWGKEKQYCQYSIGEPDYYDDCGELKLFNPLPCYSEDIKAAWDIVLHTRPHFHWSISSDSREGHAMFIAQINTWMGDRVALGEGSSAPKAICRAVLKALTSKG